MKLGLLFASIFVVLVVVATSLFVVLGTTDFNASTKEIEKIEKIEENKEIDRETQETRDETEDETKEKSKKIDIVISWGGSGEDVEHLKERSEWLKTHGLKKTQNVTYYDELKFNIKNIRKYAPWIRTIFVLKPAKCTIPKNIPRDAYVAINQEDIMDKQNIPVFNSHAVECILDRIPGLSEYFIYACDDMFFNGPTLPSYFFNAANQIIYRCRKPNINKAYMHGKAWNNNFRILQNLDGGKHMHMPYHQMVMLKKSAFRGCRDIFPKEWARTEASKFRNENDIHPVGLVVNYLVSENLAVAIPQDNSSIFIALRDSAFLRRLQRNFFIMSHKMNKANLLCINDNTTKYNKDAHRWLEECIFSK